jgi:DNA-binding protein HU-beta
MNLKELSRAMSQTFDMSFKDGDAVTRMVFQLISDALVNDGDKVFIPGFGTFRRCVRPEREGYNPATGKKETFGAVSTIKFRAASGQKDVE